MSEQNQQLQIQQYDPKVAEGKGEAWKKMGVALYKNEIVLQLKAQEIIGKLIIAEKEEDIARAEESLKATKKAHVELIEERKKSTGVLDKIIARNMQPEKTLEDPIAKATTALIRIKKEKDARLAKEKNKEDERKQIIEKIGIYIADMDAAFIQAQAKLIHDSYEHALTANIQPGEPLTAYIEKVKGRITDKNQTIPAPKIKGNYLPQEEVDALIAQHFVPKEAREYVEGFAVDIDKKYFDYKLALQNKEQALKLNQEEFQENTSLIEKEKNSNIVAAKLTTMATAVTSEESKPLKKIYKIDMEENIKNAFIINAAFMANQELCLPYLQIKNAFNLSIKQMITCLEKVKNVDNKFSFTNLLFIETDKL